MLYVTIYRLRVRGIRSHGHHGRCAPSLGAQVVQSQVAAEADSDRVQYDCLPEQHLRVGARSSVRQELHRGLHQRNNTFTFADSVHHKFTDTDADPHNVSRGMFFAHMGWLMIKKHPEVKAKGASIDMKDLEQDAFVMFQKK